MKTYKKPLKRVVFALCAILPVLASAERVVEDDITLAENTDWSADGMVTLKYGTKIDLAGHSLAVADVKQESSNITNSTGVVSGYQDLALIRTSDETLGYIETDIVPNGDERIVFKVRYEEKESQSFFFCSRTGAGTADFALAYKTSSGYKGLRIDFNGTQNIFDTSVELKEGSAYEFDFDANNKTCSIKDASATYQCSFDKEFPTTAFPESKNPLQIFRLANGSSAVSNPAQFYPRASLYYFLIYDKDGNLIHELRPAIETSTQKTGLYDRQGNKFYPSSVNFLVEAADTFGITNTAGGDAAELVVNGGTVPETIDGYTVLESIKATGSQYVKIPTDYMKLAATDRVEMKVKPTGIDGTRCFFCSRVSNTLQNFSCFQQKADLGGANGLRFDFNDTALLFANPRYKMNVGETHEIVFDGDMRMALIDGEDKGYDISPSNDFTPTHPLFILGAANGDSPLSGLDAKCELYYFRLFGKDGQLKLDMVPVYSASEGTAGLYDRVGKRFFKSETSTAFGRGDDADDTALTVAMPSIPEQKLSMVMVSRNVRLVKDGGGMLTVAKTGQTYTGGTEVRSGVLRLGSNGDYTIIPAGDTVTVGEGAVLDMNGYGGWHGRSFVLNGGVLKNANDFYNTSGRWDAAAGTSLKFLGNISLSKDSTLRIGRTYGFEDGAVLDLGGHTLTAEIAKDEILVLRNATVENGTLDALNRGWLHVPAGKTCDATDNVKIIRSCNFAIAGALNAKDFEDDAVADGNIYNSSAGSVNVSGTFTPNGGYFYGVTMQTGSLLDLSAKVGPWNVASSATANNVVTFADDATIGLLLGSRVTRGSIPVVDWEGASPSNLATLKFRRVDAGRDSVAVCDSIGVYFRLGLIISFH